MAAPRSGSVPRWALAAPLLGLGLGCSGGAAPRVSSVGGTPQPSAPPAGEVNLAPSCGVELSTSHFPAAGEEDAWLHRERAALGLQLSAERNCKGAPGELTLLVREDTDGTVKVEGSFGGNIEACDMVSCVTASVESYQSEHPPTKPRTLSVPVRASGDGSLTLDATIVAPARPMRVCQLMTATDKQLGHVPGKTMQGIVRGRFDALQGCYRQGLKRNRDLEGDVTVRFLIGNDGRVSHTGLHHLTLPDCDVAACVVDIIQGLEFPAPESGVVTVTYPLHFEPN